MRVLGVFIFGSLDYILYICGINNLKQYIMKTKFDNYGFDLTEQIIETCDKWLEFKGYSCLEEWGDKEVVPHEDAETQLGHLKGEIGYEPYYLYENLSYRELRDFTITKANFLEFYFNTGEETDNRSTKIEFGERIIETLIEGTELVMPTVEGLFDDCGYIPMIFCEEVIDGHPLEDFEDVDLDWDVEIKLID